MNKLTLLLIGLFLISLVSAIVYSTPGVIPECDCPVCEISFDSEESLTSGGDLTPWIFAAIIFIVGILLIIRREILMKKKRVKKDKEVKIPEVSKVLEEPKQ